QPARASRKYAPAVDISRSQLPAGMAGSNPAGIIAPVHALEAGSANHLGKARLVGKLADRFNQIAVGFTVARHNCADLRDGMERPDVIEPVKARHLHGRKFEAHEPPTTAQHAI